MFDALSSYYIFAVYYGMLKASKLILLIKVVTLFLQVLDTLKGERILGTMTYHIRNLLAARDMTVIAPFGLNGCGPDSKINLRLCLRVSQECSSTFTFWEATFFSECPGFLHLSGGFILAKIIFGCTQTWFNSLVKAN